MAITRSFKSVVRKEYFSDIENAVSEYIESNFKQLNLFSRRVRNPDEACLSELHFHRLLVFDTPGTFVRFDMVVIAGIEIYQKSHSEAMDEEIEKWFRVSCEIELSGCLHNFQINSIELYDHHENTKSGLVTDALVPIISSNELENIAESIVDDVYPEALERPTRIDVREFSRRLGLEIEERHLSRSANIFGEMIFNDCKVEYYDLDKKCYDYLNARGGTVLVDLEVYFLRSLGSWNNTVIHECVHRVKHRKVFELEHLYNENVSRIRCKVTESTTDEKKRSDTEWMEWHANSLAPRILMPFKQFQQKAKEAITNWKNFKQTQKTSDVIADVILELSEFFGVSVQSAKIRMLDIGYTEAIGVYEYVDNHYVSSHSFGVGVTDKNQTFSVPTVDAIIQYAVNSDFQRIIDSGNFVHVDNHYCINDPKFVTVSEHGLLEMTYYAVSHIEECCLVLERSVQRNTEYGVQRYTECALFQSAVSQTISVYNYNHTVHNKKVEARVAAMKAEILKAKETAKIMDDLPGSFGKSLVALMTWRKVTVEKLAEDSRLSAKTIQRMRNDPEYKCEIETVSAVCIGLHLPPNISTPLIEKAGLKFRTGEKGFVFLHLLATHYQNPIQEVNEYLEVAGYPPLSDKE